MPSYYDDTRKTWYCKFSYTDWTGQRRQKLKRGFTKKGDAKAWEREFLEYQQGTPDMSFKTLVKLYLDDIRPRIKESSYEVKEGVISTYLLPYFGEKPISSIKPTDVRKWQATLLDARTSQGTPFADTYLRNIDRQFVAVLNYAVKYHNLPRNPHIAAGYIGKPFANRLDFWTLDEFNHFISSIDADAPKAVFNTLYYTGIRCGEMLALTPADIDLEACRIRINKTYAHLKGRTIMTPPKTENSIRSVSIPPFLRDELKNYMAKLYGLDDTERIFPYSDDCIYRWMKKYCKAAGLPHMRIHALRHSHVSLLIDLGFSAILIAERIGDRVEMVNRIYGHLYPNRHAEVAAQLQEIVSK